MKNRERLYVKAKMKTAFYRKTKQTKQEEGDIVLRILIDNHPRAEFRTGIVTKFHEWDSEKRRFKAFSEKVKAQQRILEDIDERAYQINNLLFDADIETTPSKVLQVLTWIKKQGDRFHLSLKFRDIEAALGLLESPEVVPQMPTKSYGLLELLVFYDGEKKVGKARKDTYEDYRNNVELYLKYIGKPDLAAKDFSYAESLRFQKWMREVRGCGDVYTQQHVAHCKSAMKLGVDWELIEENTLTRFELTAVSPEDNTHLTRGELQSLRMLANAKFDDIKVNVRDLFKWERARDTMIFMCFTGLHYEDMFCLTAEHLHLDKATGEWWLVKKREKNAFVYEQLLHIEAVRILGKYGSPVNLTHHNGERVFKSAKVLTYYIRKINKALGIKKIVSTKHMRKTFADGALNTHLLSPLTVAFMMGLKDEKVLGRYARATKERVENEVHWGLNPKEEK